MFQPIVHLPMNTTSRLQVDFAPINGQTSWTTPIAAKVATRRGSRTVRGMGLMKSPFGDGNNALLVPDRFAGRRFRVLNHALNRLIP